MTFTKEQLQHIIETDHVQCGDASALARMALAGMEAEPVAWRWNYGGETKWRLQDVKPSDGNNNKCHRVIQPIYAAPQPLTTSERAELENYRNAQQVVPEPLAGDIDADDHPLTWSYHNGWNSCRAAMLQGKAEPVTTAYKFPDDFDFDRFNDVVWLEAVASNPHMHSLTTSTIAMVALELNRRLDADGKPELTVWYGPMPESIGKTNWTAILHRKGNHPWDGITIDCSEYPDRTLYEADRMRHLIGELADEPDILAYDADKHSGYVAPAKADGNSPVIPDGWVTVPVEMTAEQMRAVQIKSELGEHATANLAGAYSLFSEFWRVAISAATKKEV